ncbi:MAG: hypothetical protein KY456_00840 [Chloroflexi bacterium]|nr:hypothetical protein [Chloroflexota bacterium]
MYLHRPDPSWSTRLLGSARTLAAIVLTALLASALTVHWSDASATGVTVFTPEIDSAMAAIPVTVEGKLVGASDGLVAVVEHDAVSPVAFTVSQDARLVRGEEGVPLEGLRAGDTVRMTIDGRSGSVLRLHAVPAPHPVFPVQVPGVAAFLAALGLIGGATALAIHNIDRLPALSARRSLTRLLPAATTH